MGLPSSRPSAILIGQSCAANNALLLTGSTPALPLNDFFALNPAMPNLHRLYQAGQATIVHAIATPYRERSHFDGQDVLESGLPKPGAADTGWLNRTLAALEPAGQSDPHPRQAFAVGPITPLVVRGPAPVLSWVPPKLPPVGDDTTMRLLDLYSHTDPTFARVLEERIGLAAIARAGAMNSEPGEERPAIQAGGIAQLRSYFADAAGAAANSSPSRRVRGSARSPSTAGTPMSTKASTRAGSPTCWARSMARSPRSRRIWARLGMKPLLC